MKIFKTVFKVFLLLTALVLLLGVNSCPEDRTVIYKKAFVETVQTDFGPLDIIHLQGTPREIGLQYGYHLGAKIQGSHDAIIKQLERDLRVPAIIITSGLDILGLGFQAHIPDAYNEEIKGIVDGAKDAGVKLDARILKRAITISNFSDYDYKFLIKFLGLDKLKGLTCSSFAVWGTRTEDGKLFASRNLDWSKDTGLSKYKLVAIYKPSDGAAFATVGYAGFIGALAGMNEHGVTVGEIGSASAHQKIDGRPWVIKTREALARASNLEEAVAAFTKGPNTLGYNFIIAYGDPSGNGKGANACAIETNSHITSVIYANDPIEQNAFAINTKMQQITDSEGKFIPYGFPLPDAIYRADTAFDPAVRRTQTCSHGPASKEYDPLIDKYIPGDPSESGAYKDRYKPQYEMINAYYEGTGYSGNGIQISNDGNRTLIGMNQALAIAKEVAMKDSNVISVVYAPTDLEMSVSYESGTGDTWVNASDHEYYPIDLAARLASMK